MAVAENSLLILGVILFFGVLIPELFKKFHMPFATSLILLGALLGPNGFGYINSNNSIELFGFLGAAFLLMLTGIESKTRYLKEEWGKTLVISAANGLVPMVAGFLTLYFFGYSIEVSVLVGIMLISSSIPLVSSTVKMLNMERTIVGKITQSTVILLDIGSLLLLSILLMEHVSRFPLWIFFGIIISAIVILRLFLPELTLYIFSKNDKKKDHYEFQFRIVVALLLLIIFIFSMMGINPILAAFFVGVSIADIIKSNTLISKLHTLGYGIFVPIFFFIVGMDIDFSIFSVDNMGNIFLIVFVLTSFIAKFASGFISAALQKISIPNSLILGSLSTARLTTTLSAAYVAESIGMIDSLILTSIILVSVLSTLISPVIASLIKDHMESEDA